MDKDSCYQLGHITRTHGTKGEVQAFLDVDFPDDYDELESVFLEVKGELIPYFIENINIQKGSRAIIKFEEIDKIEQAAPLVNCGLFLPDEQLEELDDDQFYFHEIIGLPIVDAQLGQLGTVATVYNMPTQDLISMTYQGHEVMIPLSDDIVTGFDRAAQVLRVNLPEGLIEVYLNDAKNDTPDDAD
jgi:16S rRNA processing protein RimM